jgi:tetratricopeptide (TPR) repeat protein
MNPNPTMTPEMFTGLLNHLFQEGRGASQKRDMYRASMWYAQCLSIIKQLGNNEEFMSMVLYYYGEAIAHSNQSQQAIACLEASANIQKQMGNGEAEADCFYMVGSFIAALEDYEKAKKHLTEALRRYRGLNNRQKIAATEDELKKVTANLPKIRRISKSSDETLDFGIFVDKQMMERFSVSVDGEVKWYKVKGFNKSVAMGLANAWQVVCTNYPYSFF